MNTFTNMILWSALATQMHLWAETVNIQAEIDFKGSLIIGKTCSDVYKILNFDNKHYFVRTYLKNSKGYYNLPTKTINNKNLTKGSLKKVKNILCKDIK